MGVVVDEFVRKMPQIIQRNSEWNRFDAQVLLKNDRAYHAEEIAAEIRKLYPKMRVSLEPHNFEGLEYKWLMLDWN